MKQSSPSIAYSLWPPDPRWCLMILPALLALGMALASTSALAQTVINYSKLAICPDPYSVCATGTDSSLIGIVTVRSSGSVSSQISLSPDQRLARAYALCMREEVGRLDKGCSMIEDRWLSYAPNTEVDRSFIEDIAKKLSPLSFK
jgi:hypothetical protein